MFEFQYGNLKFSTERFLHDMMLIPVNEVLMMYIYY